MPKLPIRYFLLVVILFPFCVSALSQEIAAEAYSSPGADSAIALYNQAFASQLHIYNGREYQDYEHAFAQGQPYFISDNWSTASVNYDGNNYNNVSLLYNLVTDEVVILASNRLSKIQLIKERVKSFTIPGHLLVNMTRDSMQSSGEAAGYYEVLVAGPMTLLARRTKNIQSFINYKVEYKIFSKDHYFVKTAGGLKAIPGKKELFALVAGKRKEVQQFMRQNKIRYRKDPEGTMTKVIAYYNQLTK